MDVDTLCNRIHLRSLASNGYDDRGASAMTHILKPITYKDFKAFKPDGSLHSDIIKAFLIRERVYVEDAIKHTITVSDYHGLTLICDPEVLDNLKKQSYVDCLVSVQFRSSGHYAIAKMYQPKMQKDRA